MKKNTYIYIYVCVCVCVCIKRWLLGHVDYSSISNCRTKIIYIRARARVVCVCVCVKRRLLVQGDYCNISNCRTKIPAVFIFFTALQNSYVLFHSFSRKS
jgi:hypothetical protein